MTAPVHHPRRCDLHIARPLAGLFAAAVVTLAGCTPAASSAPSAPPAPAAGSIAPQSGSATSAPASAPGGAAAQAPAGPSQPAAQGDDKPTAIETAYIKGNAFSPAAMTVQAGTVVLWSNQDSVQHTVTGPGWELGPFSNGESWAHTFNKVGQEEIHCRLHPEMTMKVTVTEKKP